MHLSPHNGWENKFTWAMHLHLSNEQGLMHEITVLVSEVPNEQIAGWRLEMWVKMAQEYWLSDGSSRDGVSDDAMRLLAWDLVGLALAYADWDVLVRLLVGETITTDNLFTVTLSQCIMSYPEWQQQFSLAAPHYAYGVRLC